MGTRIRNSRNRQHLLAKSQFFSVGTTPYYFITKSKMNEERTQENSNRDTHDWRSNENNLNQVEAFSTYGSTYFQDWRMTAHNGTTDVSKTPLLVLDTNHHASHVCTVCIKNSNLNIWEIGKDQTLRVRTGLGKRPQIRSMVPEKGSVWNKWSGL